LKKDGKGLNPKASAAITSHMGFSINTGKTKYEEHNIIKNPIA
jgi:hypothetical protein